jgi:hypothetical protein
MWPPSFVQMSQAEEPGFIQTRNFLNRLRRLKKRKQPRTLLSPHPGEIILSGGQGGFPSLRVLECLSSSVVPSLKGFKFRFPADGGLVRFAATRTLRIVQEQRLCAVGPSPVTIL